MASQEDDNKLESKSNVNKEQERNFINVYKKYDYVLNNKLEPFPKKIAALIEIWKSVGQYNQQNPDIRYMVQIMDWAKLHTLNIVLTAKWKMHKDEFEQNLLAEVSRTQGEFVKVNDAFSKSCQKLAAVIKNPWDDPILANLLHDSNATIGAKEIEFFCVETTYLVCVRLKKLCESQCEDLALNLVTGFMNCYNLSQTQNFNLNATKTQILFCLDIHVALLYRYNKMSEIVTLFKKLTLEEGLQLIRRFARKRIKISKVWRNYPEITFLACQVFVTAAITKPFEESGDFLKDLLDIWISFSLENSMLDKLEDSIRRIIQAATTAEHIYICCEIVHNKVGLKLKTFTVELYIRALTTDMNNLESQKTENEVEKLEKTTKCLATGFQNLADILKDNVQVSRECALTSFSLEPTVDRLRKIEDLARTSGFNVLDTGQIWQCKLHPPVTSSDDISWKCSACGDWMCKPSLDLRLTTNFALNEALNFETLGISPQLCDDLAVVLNGPRYHLLSWLLRWDDLHRLCTMYLNDKERTKNLVTELKFVDVDYSMFEGVKREPVDELAGIEKGYEQYLYPEINEQVDIEDYPLPSPPDLPQPKSDPNTLKTLRMFRHNGKRNKSAQVPQGTIESNNVNTSCSSLNSTTDHNLFSNLGYVSPHGLEFTQQNYTQQCNSSITMSNQEVARNFNTIYGGDFRRNLSPDKFVSHPYETINDLTTSSYKSNRYHLGNDNFKIILNKNTNLNSSGYPNIHKQLAPTPPQQTQNKVVDLDEVANQDWIEIKSESDSSFNSISSPKPLSPQKPHANNRNGQSQNLPSNNVSGWNNSTSSYKSTTSKRNKLEGIVDNNPNKKARTEQTHRGLSPSIDNPDLFKNLHRDLEFTRKVMRELQEENRKRIEAELAVQNENSSKNANCFPSNLNEPNKEDPLRKNAPNADDCTMQDVQIVPYNLTLNKHNIGVSTDSPPKLGSTNNPKPLLPCNKQLAELTSHKIEHKSRAQPTNQNTAQTIRAVHPDNLKFHQNPIKNELKNGPKSESKSAPKPTVVKKREDKSPVPDWKSILAELAAQVRREEEELIRLRTNKMKVTKQAPCKNSNTNSTAVKRQDKVVKLEQKVQDREELIRLKSNKLNVTNQGPDKNSSTNSTVKHRQDKVNKLEQKVRDEEELIRLKSNKLNVTNQGPDKNSNTKSTAVKRQDKVDKLEQKVQDREELIRLKSNKLNVTNQGPDKNSSTNSTAVKHCQDKVNKLEQKVRDEEELIRFKSNKLSVTNQGPDKNSNTNSTAVKHCQDKVNKLEQKVRILSNIVIKAPNEPTKESNKDCVPIKPDGTILSSILTKPSKNVTDSTSNKNEAVPKNFQERVNSEQGLDTQPKQLLTPKNNVANDKEQLKDLKFTKIKDDNQNSLLKSISEHHKPIIVEDEEDTKKDPPQQDLSALKEVQIKIPKLTPSQEVKYLGSNGAADLQAFKNNTKAKPGTTYKELKIILHRLSTEVIRSFIPSYIDKRKYTKCECRKKTVGRPRKFCMCMHRNSRSSSPNSGAMIDYKKRLLQTEQNDKKNSIGNKNIRKLDGDRHKTAPNKKYASDNDEDDEDDEGDTKRTKKVNMNPRVLLERLPLDTDYVRSVLSNVPGLNDYEMMRPSNVNHIVNVVQISGGRPTSTVPVQSTQTSTQITPHIQRIGQPRSDKPEHNSNSEAAIASSTPSSAPATIKPTTSQPSTLINILSQQIIRPGQSNCVRNRSSPLINILSQQIIRPANTQLNKVTSNAVQTTEAQANNPPKAVTTTEQSSTADPTKTVTSTKNVSNITPGGQGTILQFICKSSLPKFQQAFGKSVYQNNTETSSDTPTTCTDTPVTNTDTNKKSPKNQAVNIQPIQGGVIYTRQMPVGQAINLIPPGRGQVFRIATSNSDQISLVKDTVIHSKMSALLAAALQGKQKTSEQQTDGEAATEDASAGARVTVARPTLVQNARLVKPVLQIPSNVIRTSPQSNLSSTTLEQLREFDMVYKQIKERSSTSTPSEQNVSSEASESSQRISVTYVNQNQKYTQLSPVVVVSSYCNLQPAASPALSVTSQGSSSPCVTPAPTPTVPKVSSKSSKGKTVKSTTTQASKASPIPKPQQKPQEDEHTTQRIFDILAEYAEQLRNSPDLNNKPAPRRRSNPPTNPSQNSKRKKSSNSKKTGQCSSMISEADTEDHRTVGSEDSSCGVVQISVQEEEQAHTPATTAATTTTESNDSNSNSRQLILTDTGNNQTRNLIIADSSVGEALKMPNTAVLVPGNYIMPVSMVKGGQQIAVVSGGSKILATVPARSGPNMLLFQSFLNQNRKSGVSTVKYSTLQPVSGISSQSIAGVSGQPPVVLPPNSHNLTAVTLGQPITLKKLDDADRVNTELLLTISQSRDNVNSTESSTHIDNSTNTITSTVSNVDLDDGITNSDNSDKLYHTYQKNIVSTTPIATPVIAQTTVVKDGDEDNGASQNSITLNVSSENNGKNESSKSLERVQSVLVTACTSNGPMLSHTPPRYRKASDSAAITHEVSTKEFLHNGEKLQQNNNDQKHFQENATYFQNKTKKTPNNNPQRLDRELHQLCLQRKQAALERELRLQKSLSEECEDLGVDEPSTSDLFPEADILFDANHSPSFDQSSQDLVKRPQPQDIKEDNKAPITLFSDDDNSGSLRTDFLFESVEYQTTTTELEYVQNQQLTNGQSSASNESGSSCGDATLLQNCPSISDVTLNSPVSPDPYNDNTTPTLNKYKFQYTNRRKGERHKHSESWTGEVSSSEDTTGSTELGKSSSHSPESCTNKHSASCDDELSDGSYKVVRVAISKSDLLKDEESCEELHCGEDDLDCSPSGRGARRSVKKMCSCCNGSQDGGVSRKRPASRPHTPAPHKKAFLNKKR